MLFLPTCSRTTEYFFRPHAVGGLAERSGGAQFIHAQTLLRTECQFDAAHPWRTQGESDQRPHAAGVTFQLPFWREPRTGSNPRTGGCQPWNWTFGRNPATFQSTAACTSRPAIRLHPLTESSTASCGTPFLLSAFGQYPRGSLSKGFTAWQKATKPNTHSC